MPPDWQREDLQTLRAVSEGLLVAAVDIALSCFVLVDDGEQGSRADLRYALNGHTVSNIVFGVCVAGVACDDARCLAVADLLLHALQVFYVAKEVGRRAIQTALNWMDYDGVDPAPRGATILTVLSHLKYITADTSPPSLTLQRGFSAAGPRRSLGGVGCDFPPS